MGYLVALDCPNLFLLFEELQDDQYPPHLFECTVCRHSAARYLAIRHGFETTQRLIEKDCPPSWEFRGLLRIALQSQIPIGEYIPKKEEAEKILPLLIHYGECSLCRLYIEELIASISSERPRIENLLSQGIVPDIARGVIRAQYGTSYFKKMLEAMLNEPEEYDTVLTIEFAELLPEIFAQFVREANTLEAEYAELLLSGNH